MPAHSGYAVNAYLNGYTFILSPTHPRTRPVPLPLQSLLQSLLLQESPNPTSGNDAPSTNDAVEREVEGEVKKESDIGVGGMDDRLAATGWRVGTKLLYARTAET